MALTLGAVAVSFWLAVRVGRFLQAVDQEEGFPN